MSRSDLLHANADIVKGVCKEIAKTSPNAIIIVVTNPMDVMAQIGLEDHGILLQAGHGHGRHTRCIEIGSVSFMGTGCLARRYRGPRTRRAWR